MGTKHIAILGGLLAALLGGLAVWILWNPSDNAISHGANLERTTNSEAGEFTSQPEVLTAQASGPGEAPESNDVSLAVSKKIDQRRQGDTRIEFVNGEDKPAKMHEVMMGYTQEFRKRINRQSKPVNGVASFHLHPLMVRGPILIVATLANEERTEVYFEPLDTFPASGVLRLSLADAMPLHPISGRVVNDLGEGADEVTVHAIPTGTHFADASPEIRRVAYTDEEGFFELDRFPAGTYRVRVLPSSSVAGSNTCGSYIEEDINAGTRDLELTVERRRAFHVTTVNHKGTAIRSFAMLTSTWTDPDGHLNSHAEGWEVGTSGRDIYPVTNANNAVHTLHVVPRSKPIDACAEITIDPWHPASGPIELTRTYTLLGKVTDHEGHALKRGFVRVGLELVPIGTRGTFSLSGLLEGIYNVEVLLPDKKQIALIAEQQSVDVVVPQAKKPTVLKLDMMPTIRVSVASGVKLEDRRRRHAVHVAVADSNNEIVSSFSASNVPETVYGIDPSGTYTVSAYGLPQEMYMLEENVRAGANVILTPKKGLTATCRADYVDEIKDRGGVRGSLAVPGIAVNSSAHATETVIFRGIPPGTWKVTLTENFSRYLGTGMAATESHVSIPMEPFGSSVSASECRETGELKSKRSARRPNHSAAKDIPPSMLPFPQRREK